MHYGIQKRKFQRLANYDYSRPGYYFVTVTLDSKKYTFGDIINGIIEICGGRDPSKPPQRGGFKKPLLWRGWGGRKDSICSVRRQHQTLPIIIGEYKSASFKLIHQLGYHDFKWHKSFNDRIIRGNELDCKRNYIKNNPKS